MTSTVIHDVTHSILKEYKMFDAYHEQLTDIISATIQDINLKGDFIALKYPEITHMITKEHTQQERHGAIKLSAHVSNKFDCQVRVGLLEQHPHYPKFAYGFVNKKPIRFLGHVVLVPKYEHSQKELQEPLPE